MELADTGEVVRLVAAAAEARVEARRISALSTITHAVICFFSLSHVVRVLFLQAALAQSAGPGAGNPQPFEEFLEEHREEFERIKAECDEDADGKVTYRGVMPVQAAVFYSEEGAAPAADGGLADKADAAAAAAESAITAHVGPGGPVEIVTD